VIEESILEICERLKIVNPHIKILLGGPEVSYDGEEILKENSFIDYIAYGEGEETFKELLISLLNNDDLDKINAYKIINAVHNVSCDKMYTVYSSEKKFHVALYDFGLKENILRELVKRGCDVTVCPYTTTAANLADMNINGVMLSNGPGDPADNPIVINNLSDLSKTGIPIFGICLGHQLLALAHGFSTGKLKYGHRGVNQPAKNITDGRIYITSQNHGYAVLRDSINNDIASELFINVNDDTCEGIKYNNIPAFSVQFHPEASAGPQDTAFLFDEFIMMLEAKKNAVK